MTGPHERRRGHPTRVVPHPARKCPLCGRALGMVVGTVELPADPLFCVIHGQVGLRRETLQLTVAGPGRLALDD
jgi:hypothetical protein